MKILIIEDELPASEKLQRYLLKYDPGIVIMNTLTSVSSSIEWLSNTTDQPDVIFMDIQLSDGLSFEIFDQVSIPCPVIFATAHDDYALDAFKVNSIDYIMKPITYREVSHALKKLNTLSAQLSQKEAVQNVAVALRSQRRHKDRFVVNKGNQIQSIKTDQIQLFYAEGRTVFLITDVNERFIIDFTLSEVEDYLDASQFFRVNRSFIVHINAIEKINKYSNSRLKINTSYDAPTDIVVSREKVSDFKKWLEG